MARRSKLMTAMFRKSYKTSDEVAAIQNLLGDLQSRLRRLNGHMRREVTGASGEAGDYLNHMIARVSDQVRDMATEAGQSMGREAIQFGSKARQRLEEGVEHRPLIALACAVGIGFLIGMAGRRA
jgi:ElaB/YqjD/DUF883 family membrane-anchored ribosome-binding protein